MTAIRSPFKTESPPSPEHVPDPFSTPRVTSPNGRTARPGLFLREPSFAIRTATYDASRTVADYIAELGVNIVIAKPNGAAVSMEQTLPEVFAQLSPADQTRLKRARAEQFERNRALAKEAHDADVEIYAFLFGNDPYAMVSTLYSAALKVYPSIKGTSMPHSHETALLCPSDPLTWKFIRAYVEDFMEASVADGMYATFWDHFGMFCQDDRCKRSGLGEFPNELYENVKQYREASTASLSWSAPGLPDRRTGSARIMSTRLATTISAAPANTLGTRDQRGSGRHHSADEDLRFGLRARSALQPADR